MGTVRRRLSYANVMATVAMFIALGGSAWALSRGEVKSRHIAKNAVKSKHVKGKAVKPKHFAKGAVRTGAVLDGSLLAADFARA